MTDNEVIALVTALHRTVIEEINEKATSEENALKCLKTYYFSIINALSMQSLCNENGNVDYEKAIERTQKILNILSEEEQ